MVDSDSLVTCGCNRVVAGKVMVDTMNTAVSDLRV